MIVKCKICLDIFDNYPAMLDHFLDMHLSKQKIIPCLFCDKELANFEDLMHHVILEHNGMENSLLENATAARETKKQLGDYMDVNKKSVGLECPMCFEMFSNLDVLGEHAKKDHNNELRPEFLAKMRKKIADAEPPLCERCHRKFPGVVFTKINKKVMNVCFNCYENYFGANALARLTIGTPDEMIKKMRKPLK